MHEKYGNSDVLFRLKDLASKLLPEELDPIKLLLEELDPVHLVKNFTFPFRFQGFQRLHDHLVTIESLQFHNILISKFFSKITPLD